MVGAAGGEADGADGVTLSLNVYEFGADKGAGLEGGVAEASLGYIGYEGYVKHSCGFLILQRYGFYGWLGRLGKCGMRGISQVGGDCVYLP